MEKIPKLVLKESCRKFLKVPLGKVYFNIDFALKRAKGKEIITVGDRTTKEFLDKKILPKLSIVDYRVERMPFKQIYLGFKKKARVKNPAGTITLQAYTEMENLLKKGPALLEVEGEEDLLALLAIILVPKNSVVFYGQPGKGLVLVEVNRDSKLKAIRLIEKCFYEE